MKMINRPFLLLLMSLSGFFISCQKPGPATILLESCVDGRLHYKNIVDTSPVWAEVSSDARIEADSKFFNPKFGNLPETSFWAENSDTTVWINFSDDSLMMLDHLHVNTPFQRFYGIWCFDGRVIQYSISQSIRRRALKRIRSIQSKYPDSVRPEDDIGNFYAKDSCHSRWEKLHGIEMPVNSNGEAIN